jgi:acetyl-CoA carboxylase carboxyl transferase subunit alpha
MPLPFEKPIEDLEVKITEMRTFSQEQSVDLTDEIKGLERRLETLKRTTFDNLTRWQRVQVARVHGRPTGLDYIQGVFTDFQELHGDRTLGDDPALIAGLAKLDDTTVVILAQQKGRDTKENIFRNFGMMHPSGYRKAMRLFDLADKFRLPVITLIDTPGAYPGIAAEEQGQAWVIAEAIQRMGRLQVPAISIVIGEGGSGGALAIGVANRVLILENAIYSVISPESCAAILWHDASEAEKAAEALKLTARDLLNLNVVDRVIDEPLGGAHKHPEETVQRVGKAIREELMSLYALSPDELLRQREARFRALGRFELAVA